MFDFYTDIPVIWWVVTSIALGWLISRFYSAQARIFERGSLIVLRLLRITALSLMLFLLLRPIFLISRIEEKPKTLVWMIDHSASMVLSADSARVRQLPSVINQINDRIRQKLNTDVMSFGSKVSEKADFDFRQTSTDGYQWIRHLTMTRSPDELAAVILVSDGIFNTSYSPEFFVGELRVPVYTVGVGDTSVYPDGSIVSVIYPKKVLPDTDFEIEIVSKAVDLENTSLKVSVKGDGVIRGGFTFVPKSNIDSYSSKAAIRAQKPGLYRYTAIMDAVPGERNIQNNVFTFFIEVIEQKGRILLIDEIKHPDIGVIRQYFSKYGRNDLVTVRPDSLKFLTGEYDLAIVHSPANPETFSYLKRNPKVPLMAILGYGTHSGYLSELLGKDVVRFGREDKVFPVPNDQFYKISTETFLYADGLPPLDAFYLINGIATSDILAYQKINGTITSRPLISLSESGRKITLIHGEGLWKWYNALRMSKDTTGMDALLLKLTRWLTQEGKRDPFEVIVPEKADSEDRFIVKAYLYDQSDLPVTNAEVSISFTDSLKRSFEYRLPSEGSMYSSAVQGLTPGIYRWKATASLPGKSWSSSGVILIEKNYIESSNLVANHTILRQIAEKTGGRFYTPDKLDELEKDLSKQNFIPLLAERSKKIKLIEWWPYFFLIFIFMGSEWFLRRYLGSY